MPIDYSKFDAIQDSDEEEETPPNRGHFMPPARQAPAAGARAAPSPPAASSAAPARGKNGRPLLEPVGLEQSLQIAQPQQPAESSGYEELLANQLEKLAASGPGENNGSGNSACAPQRSGDPKRLCMVSEGRKKIHTTSPDGGEMVEEFDEKTDVLLLRKVRRGAVLGKESEWVYEVGQAPMAAFDPHSDILRASAGNPIFLRKDTPEHFQWRIRNLPFAAEVYSVLVDHEQQEVVVRTSNKKYFKRIAIPDLRRLGMKVQDNALSWKHQHNTLIISYSKPREVLAQEQKAIKEAEKSAVRM